MLGIVPNADTTFAWRTLFASSSVQDNVWPMTRPVFVHRTVAIGDTVENRDTIERYGPAESGPRSVGGGYTENARK